MKLLFAPDSFKGSATSEHIIELLTKTAGKYFENCEIVAVPMADGGEGTLDVLVSVMKGRYGTCRVKGPLGQQTEARYGVIEDALAVVEMAEASGLTLVEAKDRNPCLATSYGTGELIRHVLEQGYTDIFLAIGGSAANDGGIGAADALGIRFLDACGNRLEPIGENLGKIEEIRTDNLIPEITKANITIMCDVQNPLLGPDGATYVYGPQKGGNKEQMDYLEAGMTHYAEVIRKQFGIDVTGMKGAGAAGGVSIPFLAFCNARIESGIQAVLKIIRFDELLDGVDFVVTGEGRVDWQSSYGKVLAGIGAACRKKGIPVAAIAGGMGKGAAGIYDCGIDSIVTAVNNVMDLDTAMQDCDELIGGAAERLFRLIRMGMRIEKNRSGVTDERAMETSA